MFISDLNIESDFYSDPQIKLLFKEEHLAKISSRIMWALVLDVHPNSKFSDLDPDTRRSLITKDYLDKPSFEWDSYKSTTLKIINSLPSTADRFLATWKIKLDELNDFLVSIKVSSDTYEMLTKIMKDFYPMMKQYKEIEKEFQKQQDLATHGGVEESLVEKGLLF